MSIKHRVKDRAADGKIRPLYMGWDYVRTRNHREGYKPGLGKSPRWWRNEFHNRPRRTATARLCRAIAKGTADAESTLFPLEAKPHVYYW